MNTGVFTLVECRWSVYNVKTVYFVVAEKMTLGSLPPVKYAFFPMPGGIVLAYVEVNQAEFPWPGTGGSMETRAWLAGQGLGFPGKLSQQQPMTRVKKKILVIDNDPASTRMVRLTLERQPAFEVRELNHPTTAVRIAREFRPDLILLDVEMPGMDGGEVARDLQTDATLRALPIIFVTSLVTEEETMWHPTYTNGLRVLAKPVTMAKLVRCVAERLDVLCAVGERNAGVPMSALRD